MKCNKCGKDNCKIIEVEQPLETWKIVCAILFFPIGLLLLLVRSKKNVKYCPDCGHKEDI